MPLTKFSARIHERFRGFLPVVVDVETGGFDSERDALLEIAAVPILMNAAGEVVREITGIDPTHPFRAALDEKLALDHLFAPLRKLMKELECTRAILVGHNAHFDLGFVNAAIKRTGHKRSPFHPFSCFDTVSFAGLAFGQTVLSRAVQAAGLSWNSDEAHSAVYDAERTADLFCVIVNRWKHFIDLAPDATSAPIMNVDSDADADIAAATLEEP